MKTFRIVVGILAIIPLALLADKLLFHAADYDEDSLNALAFFIFGIPILFLNFWGWFWPEMIESFFLGKKKEE